MSYEYTSIADVFPKCKLYAKYGCVVVGPDANEGIRIMFLVLGDWVVREGPHQM